jgi:hypothetical protein
MADQAHAAIQGRNDFKKIPSDYVPVLDTLVHLGISAIARVLSHKEAESLHGEPPGPRDEMTPPVKRLMQRGFDVMDLSDKLLLAEADRMAEAAPHLLKRVATDRALEHMDAGEKRIMALRLMMVGALQVKEQWMEPALRQLMLERGGQLKPSELVDTATHPVEEEEK